MMINIKVPFAIFPLDISSGWGEGGLVGENKSGKMILYAVNH